MTLEVPASVDEKTLVRFWAKVDKSPGHGPNGDCWIWTGYRDRKGYGRFRFMGKAKPAQRVSYIIEHGGIGSYLHACHHCDNPPCCRPSHLFAGSPKENVSDSIEKGRFKRAEKRLPNKFCKHGHPMKGENLMVTVSARGIRRRCLACRRVADAKRGRRRKRSNNDLLKHNLKAAREWTKFGVILDLPKNTGE